MAFLLQAPLVFEHQDILNFGCKRCLSLISYLVENTCNVDGIRMFGDLQPQDCLPEFPMTEARPLESEVGALNCVFADDYVEHKTLTLYFDQYAE